MLTGFSPVAKSLFEFSGEDLEEDGEILEEYLKHSNAKRIFNNI